ncbi:MAG TPA: NAD(P)H-hydrate dehydratase [Xanthobacteraceae bacterium]|nr:NAD(P)H-hydrate dehydratase [Xanthobacteraceae bacterium]
MELLTTAEMAEADRLTIASGTPGIELMRAAGKAVAEVATDLADEGPVLVVAGPGNNGGDGFVAATELLARGRDVAVALLGDPARLRGDAAIAFDGWEGPVLAADPETIAELAQSAVLIIDALFGAGLDRPVAGEARAVIEAMNGAGIAILAVDLPSGLSGTTGAIMGAAVKATETITFFRCKPGHMLLPGRLQCGRVRLADIGIADDVLGEIRPQTFSNEPDFWEQAYPVPRASGHKYSRGHVVVVSGGIAATGAARLSARAALRGGAGLVTVASPPDALAVNAAALTAVMVREVAGAADFSAMLADGRINACVIGPAAGVGERTREMVLVALEAGRGVVLDADAMTSFADDPATLFAAIKAGGGRVVMTPHEGEFDRLFKSLSGLSEAGSKLERARLAAAASGAVVLLKGADTVVAAPDGRASIALNAPPWLATAGSGDVLSGLVGAMLAQGVAAFEAASIAVWMHGETGAEAGPGLIAEDLPEVLPAVTRRIFDRFAIDY